jgi:apolipoprotein N-acyltransferase
VVYYVSSESSLKEESKLAPYRAQMMARAVENSVYVVAANAPANYDLTGSHGQSRIIAQDGNIQQEASIFGDETLVSILKLAPGTPFFQMKMLNGPLADWWRSGIDQMMKNRHKQLE